MKKTILLTLLWFFLAGALHAGEPAFPLVAVEDGDTLVVEIAGAHERIQLAAIDAPEAVPNPKFQRDLARTKLPREALLALGRAATEHLESLVKPGASLRLRGDLHARDKYGRIAVEVVDATGRSLNEQMVADGFARMYSRSPIEPGLQRRLQAAQKTAMAQGRGLWGAQGEAARAWAGLPE